MTNKWISVNDRLPEDNGSVQSFLVCLNIHSASCGKVTIKSALFGANFNLTEYERSKLTHWMQLPAPPEGD